MFKDLRQDLKYEIFGIILVAVGALAMVSLATERAGVMGKYLSLALTGLVGGAGYMVPLIMTAAGIQIMVQRRMFRPAPRAVGTGLIFLGLAAALHLPIPSETAWDRALSGDGGGLLGAALALGLEKALGQGGRGVFLTALFAIGLILTADRSIFALFVRGHRSFSLLLIRGRNWLFDFVTEPVEDVPRPKRRKRERPPEEELDSSETAVEAPLADPAPPTVHLMDGTSVPMEYRTERSEEGSAERKQVFVSAPKPDQAAPAPAVTASSEYCLPPIDLLAAGSKAGGPAHKDIAGRTKILEETLDSFGVKARVVEIHQGPTITRYELQPAPGIRVSRITTLQNDLALSLAAPQVRIEAPIPGKAAVGIEVPNKEVTPVLLRDVIDTPEYQEATSRLTVALGKDIAGRPVFGSLEKMPHLLIAGSTGSGKSVCINAIIMSLLLRARPDEVKLMMIDPKMVELSHYNGVPHLIAPVVTDPKKAAGFLRWAVKEMENRYELFAAAGVRDMGRYNAAVLEEEGADASRILPNIVLILDELADLMMVAPVDVEDAICRLAQMARAAGIHLVVATQRPSVDVITGLIKANIPSRIAFAVASQIDSRTILDMGGAEKLLGKGDMLYHPVGSSKPLRVQGAFVSEKEIAAVVEFTKRQGRPEYGAEPLALDERGDQIRKAEGGSDDLFPTAVRIVMEHGQASVSILQRRLRISYNRAARLIDDMESRGLIGPYQGSKPRDVLIGAEDYARLFGPQGGSVD